MSKILSDLRKRFPLGEAWLEEESFGETIVIGGEEYPVVGLAATAGEMTVTGSSVGSDEAAYLRAYFELLERTAIVDALRDDRLHLPVRALDQGVVGQIARGRLWPKSTAPGTWQYAKSNGVAAHTSWANACRSAAHELIERDRILRSWYHGLRPQVLERTEVGIRLPAIIAESYECKIVRYGEGDVDVVGIFAFPRSDALPFVYGLGAGPSVRAAADKALDECRQRLAFLWGEELPDATPSFSPTADFHQEFYLQREPQTLVRSWLSDGLPPIAVEAPLGPSPATSAVTYVDITPAHLAGACFVVKALADEALPLFFGRRWEIDPSRVFHPVA